MITCDRMNFHAPTEFGKTRHITTEGYLLCEAVPIARIGTQVYGKSEVPCAPNKDGFIEVLRSADEVFSEVTINSFNGKSVTVEHPNEFVNPENWKSLTVGTANNVRRGDGIEDDLLIADLLITDAAAIAYINKALPQISAGYTSDYEELEPGKASQRNIVGNHIAIVDRGRAGSRVSFRDEESQELLSMSKNSLVAAVGKLFTAFQAKDEAAIAAAVATFDDDGDDTMDSKIAKAVKDAFDARDAVECEKKKKEKEAEDAILSAETAKAFEQGKNYTGDSFKVILGRAEILSPGIAVPTTDAESGTTVPALMKAALVAAQTADAATVEPFLMGRKVTDLEGADLLGVFNGASAYAGLQNNAKARALAPRKTKDDWGGRKSIADINAANAAFWAERMK